MKKILVLFIISLSFVLIYGDDAKAKEASPPAENVICKKCDCDVKAKTIKCSNKGLKKMFSTEEWTALNSTKDDYEILLLDKNQLEKIDVPFPTLRFALKTIDFSHNNIKEIVKNAFTNLDYVEEINLRFNELKSEKLVPQIFEGKYNPDEYEPLRSLKRLILSYNLLNNLDSELFEHTKHLEELYLDNNPFQIIHTSVLQAFTDLHQLQKLDMSRMELSSLPDDIFHPLGALVVLKLEGNLFKTIPQAVKRLVNLKELSLTENPIGDLNDKENFLPVLPKLEKLNMTYMGSMHVIGKGSLAGLESLKILRLSHNHHLSYIHPAAFSFPEIDNNNITQWPIIKKLFLENNNLSTIDGNLFTHWSELEEVHIHDNPWLCDCDLEWVIEELMPVVNKTTPHLIEHVSCDQPKPLQFTKLLDLNSKHTNLRCLDKYGAHPERDSALLVALLIGVLLGIPMAFASIMIYKRTCARQNGPADFSRAFYKRADMQDDIHI